MFEEAELSAAARTYVFETAPVLALRLDSEIRVIDANAQARRLLGEDIVGSLLAERLVDFVGAVDLAKLVTPGEDTCRLTVGTVSGLPETVYFRFFPLHNGTLALGSVGLEEQLKLRDEVLGLNRELNDLTRQLHLANAELRELNDLKSRFLGMAAHDLRKPIGVIMTYSEFVLDEAGDKLDEEQRGFLRTCLAASTGMKRLVDNFLDVSVIESGQLRLEPGRTDVAEILSGVLPLVRLIAAKKRIQLFAETSDDNRTLIVDVAKLQQVLVNLLSNAIEHSKPGSRVWLATRWDRAELVFSVRDEGEGLRIEDLRHLFVPFGRAGTRKTSGERSTGLGLSIARQVVEAHRGRIWVESQPGEGATFFVAIPGSGAVAGSAEGINDQAARAIISEGESND